MQIYASSTGITRAFPGYGKTCRKDVLRGVVVPVMPGAAVGTPPVPHRQLQARQQVSARGARLAGRVPAVDDHDPLTRAFGLVLQLTPELTEGRVQHRAIESGFGENAGTSRVRRRSSRMRCADAAVSAATAPTTPRTKTPSPRSSSTQSGWRRSPGRQSSCRARGKRGAVRRGSCSRPGARSRTYGSTGPLARYPDKPGLCTPSAQRNS